MLEKTIWFMIRRIPVLFTIFLLAFFPFLGTHVTGKEASEFYLLSGIIVTVGIIAIAGNWGNSFIGMAEDMAESLAGGSIHLEKVDKKFKFYKSHSFLVAILYTIVAIIITYYKYKTYF
ncbi:MAG: hypothetical protein ACI35O_17375 [Bacillaceae bacterium]